LKGDSTTTIINEDGEEFQIKARFIMDASGYGRSYSAVVSIG
jgi:hypothetical protein